jgi:hypothetical protein
MASPRTGDAATVTADYRSCDANPLIAGSSIQASDLA